MDPQIFQERVQRTPKFENLQTSLLSVQASFYHQHASIRLVSVLMM